MSSHVKRKLKGHRQLPSQVNMENTFIPVSEFKFMSPLEDDSVNGLYLNNIYLPEEVIANILNYVPPKHLLQVTLVCKKWCNIIKSENFWMNLYNNKCHPNKAKKLPWYVFYCYFATTNFNNLIKNGNGQNKYKHWKIIDNYGDGFSIEKCPNGSDPLPLGIPEFNGHTSCFVTSYHDCKKVQKISLKNKRLLRYILNKFMPNIYISEWVTGRFDCGCIYELVFKGYNESYDNARQRNGNQMQVAEQQPLFCLPVTFGAEQWQGGKWHKVELFLKEYPVDVAVLTFQHTGCDTQFWKGHYGSKMAGGVVKILFDTIEPLGDDPDADIRQLRQRNAETTPNCPTPVT